VFAKLKRFGRDEDGSTFVEFTVAMLTFMLILFGIVDFTHAFYQWNAATKATQYGARLAAVSSPVATGLSTYTGLDSTHLPGDGLPANAYNTVCRSTVGGVATCTPAMTGTDNDGFKQIVFGRDAAGVANSACVAGATQYRRGMCNFYDDLKLNNVEIQYQYTGLGYAGRPGGAVPTITVRLRTDGANAMPFKFFFLKGLMGFNPITMPALPTTVTGEDLNKAKPSS
jgi:Flp pilus assembly protein TadG